MARFLLGHRLLFRLFHRLALDRQAIHRLEAASCPWFGVCRVSRSIGSGSVLPTVVFLLVVVCLGANVVQGDYGGFLLRSARIFSRGCYGLSSQCRTGDMAKGGWEIGGGCLKSAGQTGVWPASAGIAPMRELVHCRNA